MSQNDEYLPLVERAKANDQAAAAKLANRLKPLFLSIAKQVLRNEHEAEEVVMIALEQLLTQGVFAFDPAQGKFLGYAITLVRRRTLDRLRTLRAREKHQTKFFASRVADEPYFEDEELIDLTPFLVQLSDGQRQVATMISLGYSDRTGSAALGIPMGTYKTRREYAIKNLRRMIREADGEVPKRTKT